jgi:hypothetical protein
MYGSLAVLARSVTGPCVETVDTRQQETIDNDRAFDLLVATSLWGPR